MFYLNAGDEVAVITASGQVLAVQRVHYVGSVFVELEDGRRFATIGGFGLNNQDHIELATNAHRQAPKHIDEPMVVPFSSRRKHRGRTPGSKNRRIKLLPDSKTVIARHSPVAS